MASWTTEERQRAIVQVQELASTDPEFRQRALANPAEAVKEVTGKDLPSGFELRMVSNEGADLTLVLPDLEFESEELSDADLEQIAGGRCAASCAASCAVTSTLGVGIPGVGGAACV